MKLKAIAAAALAAPLVVACGSTEQAKQSFKLNGAGATFPAPSTTLGWEHSIRRLETK